MKDRTQFRNEIKAALDRLDPENLSYDKSEFWMIQPVYEYIEYYSVEKRLFYTAVALRLVRGLHDGVHRKARVMKDGVAYRLPYAIHCLKVCKMLADLNVPLSREEEDILLASALCHDMIEDISFPEQGKELVTKYHLDPRVYETVKQVSKRRDFTPEQEREFFHGIETHKLALLVKLSDRSHNVEDLYNMSVWKVHEYVQETRTYFLPMCDYGIGHYPELRFIIEILRDKIIYLTEAAEILVDRYEAKEQELKEQIRVLKRENERLRRECTILWEK